VNTIVRANPKHAAEQGIMESEALEKGLKEKSAEFVEKGAEVCVKAWKANPSH
jgi:hypothetical protein